MVGDSFAAEVKAAERVSESDLRALRALAEELQLLRKLGEIGDATLFILMYWLGVRGFLFLGVVFYFRGKFDRLLTSLTV